MEAGFLNETKSILKSLVISCPNGMTVDRLNRDYKEMVGTWIPFKKLGYQTLELFLKGIPDTLVLTGYGRDARVGFVSNDKTQHINEMISKQKNTTRDRKVAVRTQPVNSNSSHTRTYGYPPPDANIYCNYNSQSRTPILPLPAYNLLAWQPLLPQLLYQAPTNLINFKQTQPGQQQFNKQKLLSDINTNQNTNNFKNSTTNAKAATKNAFNNDGNSRRMLSEPNVKNVSIEIKNLKISDDQKKESDDRKMSNDKISLPIASKSKDSNMTFPKQKYVIENQKSSKDSPTPITTPTKTSAAETALKNDKTASLPQEKKNTSDIQGLKFPSKTPATAPAIKFGSKKFTSSKVIKRPDLPTVSESKPLDSKKEQPVDSKKSSEIVTSMDKTKFITDPFGHDDSSDDLDEAIPEFAADFKVFHVDFPDDTVPFGRKIPNNHLPKDIKKGAVVGVFVSEIHSPFKFWFHVHKVHHELDVLMSGMENFYSRIGDNELVIPKSCINPGQVCVALYNGIWHRAEILTNVSNNKVKVNFVDYGTVSEVEIDCIKYLRNCFAETAVQAIRGSLSHIKPNAQLWPKSAIQEFLTLVSEVLLYAQIVEIDEKEKTAYMVLCDTNSGKTLQINKQLVDRGFAKLDSEWDEKKIAKNGYRKRHPRDIFPTFEMLETGEYPSLLELEQLLAQGIDYEKITEKIILSNVESSVCDEMRLLESYSSCRHKRSFHLLDTNPFKCDIISEIVSLKMFNK